MKNHKIKKVANAIIYFLDNKVKFLGSTKLMKMLFFADKFYINELAKPIFNYNYKKKERGPVPAEVYSIIQSVQVGENSEYEEEVKAFSKYVEIKRVNNNLSLPNTEFQKKQEFDKRFFNVKELNVLDRVIKEFKDVTKQDISDISHNENCWQFSKKDETIEFFSMADDRETQEYMLEKLKIYQSFRQHIQR